MRVTIRFNEEEWAKLQVLKTKIKEDDISKVIKFGIEQSNHYLDYVTQALVPPSWDVYFVRKRKTMELKKKVFQ